MYYPFAKLITARTIGLILVLAGGLLLSHCRSTDNFSVEDQEKTVTVKTPTYTFQLEKPGFKFRFLHPDGTVIAPAHPVSGLQIGIDGTEVADISDSKLLSTTDDQLELEVATAGGLTAKVAIQLLPNSVKMAAFPSDSARTYSIIFRTGGLGPAYGMGDHAAFEAGKEDLVLEDFVRDPLSYNNGSDRMVSNFAVFPRQGFATINMEAGWKVVRITDDENAQGSREVHRLPANYYFMGSPKEIYRAFLAARNREGYTVYRPKPEWFGVGWEAFGALAWNTNSESIRENINQYLDEGYPLEWMVVGSGFWPRGTGEFDAHGTPYGSESTTEAAKKLQATTSFGMWDQQLYPDPKGFIDYFHQKGLILTIGLRIGFIPGGPFTDAGLEKGYFLTGADGTPELKKVGFPRVPVYLLDTRQSEAVDWYVGLCEKWLAYGVDGFKEDLFGWPNDLPDDLIDPVNRSLMEKGVYIMGRNNYLGSPADIHRYNDFNYNQNQDRGPINGLACAYSGFPNVYPDIVGGTGLATGRFGEESQEKLRVYLVRYAQLAALNPSMAFGYGPWNFDEKTNQLCLAAARLHDRLVPHIYSNALRAYQTGFPYPMTPLPLAYPDDTNVYGKEDTTHRRYEWLIGESLLAAPLFGDDYDRVNARSIYLPAGKWMDYAEGTIYEGGQTLENFRIPLEKIPLFVGGTGFVVERENGRLLGRLYPLNPQSETTFWHRDGETISQIQIDVKDWKDLTVTDKSTGEAVDVELVRHAYQFVLEPGKDYRIN